MKLILALLVAAISFGANAEFSNESELSVLVNGGNTKMESYNLKTLSKKKMDKNVLSFGGHYTLGTTTSTVNGEDQKTETARNWDVNAKYERVFTESLNGLFAVKYEGDEFSGIKQRDNYDLGAKYKFTDTDKVKTFFELAYRYSLERRTVRNDKNEDEFVFHKAKLYFETSRKHSETVSSKFWVEYLPNFTESKDYLITVEPSVAVTLSSTFSLKAAYKVIYDNQPVAGNQMHDFLYTTSLLAKF